jgi:ribonuclease H / adenosylcobalamin/alpha-ribazole phosphatase
MREVILIRHGESEDNASALVTGESDAGLTARGRSQAVALASRLAREGGLVAVYTSPQRRATETASLVADASQLATVIEPRFCERSMGTLAGVPLHELRERFPAELRQLRQRSRTFRPPGGETLEECAERAVQALADLIAQAPSGKVAIVSHAATIALLLERSVLRIGHAAVTFITDNCALHRFRLIGADEVKILALNDTSHLTAELRDDPDDLSQLVRARRSAR